MVFECAKKLILSDRGILLAVAEQLDLAPLDINPAVDLRDYGLDSVANSHVDCFMACQWSKYNL